METLITLVIAALLIVGTVVPYYRRLRRREAEAHNRLEELKLTGHDKAVGLHPHIDALECVGCGSCVDACPEEDVLAVVDGKAVLVHGAKCVGHGRCADACPVGAIRLVMAPPGRSAEFPLLTPQLETTLPNIFVAGELGGLGLIRNAVAQGISVIREIASRPRRPQEGDAFDVIIVGAGPAGLASALSAKERGLRYLVLEQETIGGTIMHYPRRKIVLTSPFELPLWGKVRFTEISKEEFLRFWERVLDRTQLNVKTSEKVLSIIPGESGYVVGTPRGIYAAGSVVLAMGRRGTPRKLGVPGEDLGKVMYQLLDAGSYANTNILVVGGGDSAVEAALALSRRGKNRVTLSYRQQSFTRIKQKNEIAISESIRRNQLRVLFNSTVREILPDVVLVESDGGIQTVNNDVVFVLAGGELPFGFLRDVGIGFQHQSV
ncbi:MAG: NAD(P)-binding domain-containing protein [Bacteroidetes bacterium]|nr:NAD(P)-binding domain-containing protein [Bacteroidota bacterium]